MNRELGFLNFICVAVAVLFLALAALNAFFSAQFFTTDNLFVTVVCLVMALLFIVNPLLYLKSENRLPIPFMKREPRPQVAQLAGAGTPPLLDARGRAVPPDVKAMMAGMAQKPKE